MHSDSHSIGLMSIMKLPGRGNHGGFTHKLLTICYGMIGVPEG